MMFNYTWSRQHQTQRLLNNEIHVWCASLEAPPARLEYLYSILSEDETNRAVRYCFERDRRHFIVRRGLLRHILSKYLGQSPCEFVFCYNSYGKPALVSTSGEHLLHFNVSHSGRLALYAITPCLEVGVDIELVRPVEDAKDIVKHFFSNQEKVDFITLPERMKQQAFYTCWTRKEAYIKARGEGLSYPLDKFSVSMIPNQPARLLQTNGDNNKWSLRAILPGAGYVAAVVAKGHGWSIRYWEWSW